MISGTTRSGFAFEVDEAALNDMELFEAITDLDTGDARAIVPISRKLLGSQKAALYAHLRDGAGRVPVDRFAEEIADIFSATKETKKS